MKTNIITVALVLLVVAGAVFSDTAQGEDVVGIYFDTEAESNCITGIQVYTPISAYLIYTDPTPEAIRGLRMGIQIEGEFLVLNANSPCNPLIIDDGVNFECEWASAQPTSPIMVLASFDILNLSNDGTPLFYHLGSLDDPWNGLPEVLLMDGNWMETALPFGAGVPVASVNSECVVATGESTFDYLKALYR